MLLLELAVIYKILAGARSNHLVLFAFLLVTGTVTALCWTLFHYEYVDYQHESAMIEAALALITNGTITINFWLYACRHQVLADAVYMTQHAGAEGRFHRLRYLKIAFNIWIVLVQLGVAVLVYYRLKDNYKLQAYSGLMDATVILTKVVIAVVFLSAVFRIKR